MKSYRNAREIIEDLKLKSPHQVADAKIRAETQEDQWEIDCAKCQRRMKILHIFPQFNPHDDPIMDTAWHVRCETCDEEHWITITAQQ